MNSTKENPLAFFDDYFENQIYKDLENFYHPESYHNVDGVDSINWDKTNHIISITYIDQPNKLIYDKFEDRVIEKLDKEIKVSISFIEQNFKDKFSDKLEVNSIAEFLRIKLKTQRKYISINEFKFLDFYFTKIEKVLNSYSNRIINYNFTLSFNLLSESSVSQMDKIEKLFSLLTQSPSLINCKKNEFKKAFTGKQLDEGIHWLVVARNNQTSKVSLFYFINQLILNNHLDSIILNDLNKYVKYVFRDFKGNEFKNLKQSKATFSQKTSSKDRIDDIISSLN